MLLQTRSTAATASLPWSLTTTPRRVFLRSTTRRALILCANGAVGGIATARAILSWDLIRNVDLDIRNAAVFGFVLALTVFCCCAIYLIVLLQRYWVQYRFLRHGAACLATITQVERLPYQTVLIWYHYTATTGRTREGKYSVTMNWWTRSGLALQATFPILYLPDGTAHPYFQLTEVATAADSESASALCSL